jgi:hypothetical protein
MSTDGSKRSVNVRIALYELLGVFRIVDVIDVDGNESRVRSDGIVLSGGE